MDHWDYIRDLFIMPDGLTMQGTQKAADKYYANQNYYPYQVYFNWNEPADCGNILYNDKKFVRCFIRGITTDSPITAGCRM